jgi:hypothetical protein
VNTPEAKRRLLRWLLVLPAALAGWWAALLLGFALLALGDSQCPAEERMSNACLAPWYAGFERAVYIVCAAIAAALVVLLPALTAPAHRRRVGWIACGWGAITALWLGANTGAHLEALVALFAGLAAAIVVHRFRIAVVAD